MTNKKIITSLNIPFSVSIPTDKAMRALNLALVGDEIINKYENDESVNMVGKYDDHPNFPKLQDAHAKIARVHGFLGKFNLYDNGDIEFVEIIIR